MEFIIVFKTVKKYIKSFIINANKFLLNIKNNKHVKN